MKVVVLQPFKDLEENKYREVGEKYITNKERFEFIQSHGDFLKEVKEENKKVKKSKKK